MITDMFDKWIKINTGLYYTTDRAAKAFKDLAKFVFVNLPICLDNRRSVHLSVHSRKKRVRNKNKNRIKRELNKRYGCQVNSRKLRKE